MAYRDEQNLLQSLLEAPASAPARGAPPVPQPVRKTALAAPPPVQRAGRGLVPDPPPAATRGRGNFTAPLAAPPSVPGQKTLPVTGIGEAQAAAPPLAAALPPGITSYQYGQQGNQTGYGFVDPNLGSHSGAPTRGYATLPEAEAAYARAQSPQGVTDARAALAQRFSNLQDIQGGTPTVYGSETAGYNRLALTPQEESLLKPRLTSSAALSAPRPQRQQQRPPLAPPQDSGDIEIIRGTKSQVIPGGSAGMGALDLYNTSLEKSVAANLRGGVAGAVGPGYVMDESGRVQQLSTATDELRALKAGPGQEQMMAQALQEYLNPATTRARRNILSKLFAKSKQQSLYRQPVYDDIGTKIGETPYLYGEEGVGQQLQLPSPALSGAGQGGPGRQPADYPDAYQGRTREGTPGWFVKRDGKTYQVSE